MKQPIITKARAPWITNITLKGSGDPFAALSPARDHASLDTIEEMAASMGINTSVVAHLDADPHPLPETKDREYYYGNAHISYWLSGLQDFLRVHQTAEDMGIDMNNGRYFELGCASGRVVRHVACQTTADVWCCDLNLRHIEWIRVFLPEHIKVFHNHGLPHLPLLDCYFDLVSAFSVFTHIDEFEFAWLLELRRILKPGGLAYLTIQSENTWEEFKLDWIRDQLMPLRGQITEFEITADLFNGPLPKEKTVFWWPTQDVYNSIVFHTTSYIRRDWGRFFEVIDIRRKDHVYQDVVILRRPD